MRQTIGSMWIFQLVIFFILIFAAYLALTINYSKAFRVKNEVLSIIEEGQGLTDSSINLINDYLQTSAYNEAGRCIMSSAGQTYGATSLSGGVQSLSLIDQSNASDKFYYCVTIVTNYHSYFTTRSYYKVKLFFRFDLPIIGQIATFDVDGQTSEIDRTFGLK